MAIKITEECINCGACETECPNQAITEGNDIYLIDSAKCTECVGYFDTKQCVDVCPVDCCVPDEAQAETEDQLFAKAKKLDPSKAFPAAFPSHFKKK